MRWVINKKSVVFVLVMFGCYVIPIHDTRCQTLTSGESSADAAATFENDGQEEKSVQLPLRFGYAMNGAYAQPDTTEFEFPEEEKKHLARDLTIFVIASAFVAYFVIKVFLEGDTDESNPSDNGGKVDPGS